MEGRFNNSQHRFSWNDGTQALEIYNNVYWPKLRNFIINALQDDGQKQLQSFEELYSCVYKCMHNQHSEMLYEHLIALLKNHVQGINQELYAVANQCSDVCDISSKCEYIVKLCSMMKLYGRALQGFVPLFNYLNRVHVQPTFHVNLEEQLLDLFKSVVVNDHAHPVIGAMMEVRKVPFAVDPAVMAELATSLHSMNLNLSPDEAEFFSFYVPNTKPPSQPRDLEEDILMTKQLQFRLQEETNFRRSCGGKRSSEQVRIEDDECQGSMLSSILSGYRP